MNRPVSLQPLPSSRRRFGWLDAARGVAALAVMVQHSLEGSGIEQLGHGSVGTTWLNLGETGVAVFFLVSGFIIPASVQGGATWHDFWIRRVLRIYPLYWTVFALTLALTVVLQLGPVPPIGRTILIHAVFVQEWVRWPNFVGGAWTLLIELVWYVAFSVLFFGRIAIGPRLVWLGIAAYAAVVALMWIFWPEGPFGRISLLGLCLFGYAYLLRTEKAVTARHFRLMAGCFTLLLALSLFERFYLYPSHIYFEVAFSCVVISWSLALIVFALLWSNQGSTIATAPLLQWLGRISFSVYLLHSPTIIVLRAAGVSGIWFVLATFAITLPLATLMFRLVEQPGLEFARTLTQRRRRPIAAEVAVIAGETR